MSTTVEEIKKTETSENKKSELLLDSLEIKGYRCFEHLTIEKLGRVNLIVGKNNVGKTALLEALSIYASSGNPSEIVQLNLFRDENTVTEDSITYLLKQTVDYDAPRHLFFNRPKSNGQPIKFIIGSHPINSGKWEDDSVEITFNYFSRIQPSELKTNRIHENEYPYLFLRFDTITNEVLAELWDEIILTPDEENISLILRVIAPNIEKINFAIYPKGSDERIPLVKVKEFNEPVPLRSLGEGVHRLLAIALSIVNCQGGMLFIDEIEIGLHYSVLPDVWKLIFKTAKDLNVQVFATTHSKDCVEAFAQIANENDEKDDGMLIRLERHGEKIVAKTINEDRLAQAVNHDVEVR